MREQGEAAAWCGRLLLFAALAFGIVMMHTFGHPMAGHGGHDTLSARVARPAAQSPAGPSLMAQPLVAQPLVAQPVAGTVARSVAQPGDAPSARAGDSRTGGSRIGETRATAPDGAMDPGSVCRAVLSVWALALLVLLGVGTLTGRRTSGLLAALRARLLRGLWPIPPPPRHKLLARLSVLRV